MLMEEVLRRENLIKAYHRVRANKGAPGVDGMTVDDLKLYLKEHWPRIKEQLIAGTYQPQPMRRVDIPKPGGKGVRSLGIPTVLDRFIQQAILEVLAPIFDPHFSASSYASARAEAPMMRCDAPGSMWKKAIAVWWISTWKCSSIPSTTTCLWHEWPDGSRINDS